jgi:hypothetical protein
VYEILEKMPKNHTTVYYDYRRNDWPQIFDIRMQSFRRSIGVILQHEIAQEDIVYDTYAKKSVYEGHRLHTVRPIYPKILVPSLIELLDRENFPVHDDVRMKLLKWIISDRLENIDLSGIPPNYFGTVLTLFYMVEHGFISVKEADILLLSIKHVLLDLIPESLIYPPVVNERAFRISHLYCSMFNSTGRFIKQCGLSDFSKSYLIFDGVLFHKLYLDLQTSITDPLTLLTEINHCRIYREN